MCYKVKADVSLIIERMKMRKTAVFSVIDVFSLVLCLYKSQVVMDLNTHVLVRFCCVVKLLHVYEQGMRRSG